MGQHCLEFPRMLYDALLCLDYNGDVPIYRYHLSMADGRDVCETSMMIPVNPVKPWMGSVISSEPDTTVEQAAHVALMTLCESPHRYCSDADHAFPKSESGKSRVEAAP
jgi:hypothetical protein